MGQVVEGSPGRSVDVLPLLPGPAQT